MIRDAVRFRGEIARRASGQCRRARKANRPARVSFYIETKSRESLLLPHSVTLLADSETVMSKAKIGTYSRLIRLMLPYM